jgi:hypothetical protein
MEFQKKKGGLKKPPEFDTLGRMNSATTHNPNVRLMLPDSPPPCICLFVDLHKRGAGAGAEIGEIKERQMKTMEYHI